MGMYEGDGCIGLSGAGCDMAELPLGAEVTGVCGLLLWPPYNDCEKAPLPCSGGSVGSWPCELL